MNRPAAATDPLVPLLRQMIGNRLRSGGRLLSKEDADVAMMLKLCDRLQSSDVVNASLFKCEVATLCGDIDEALRWTANAGHNGAKWHAKHASALALSNLGFVTRAAELMQEVLDFKSGNLNACASLAFATASFSNLGEALQQLEQAGGKAEADSGKELVASVLSTVEALGVAEEDVRRMLDQAGALLRAKGLLWLDVAPDYHVSKSVANLSISYRLAVSPSEASELNWDLAEKLAAEGPMPDGVCVAFVGMSAAVAAA